MSNIAEGFERLVEQGRAYYCYCTTETLQQKRQETVDLTQARRGQGSGACMGFKYDINTYLASQGDRVPAAGMRVRPSAQRSEPTRQAMAMTAAKNLAAALSGQTPPNLLNPDYVTHLK